jgi:hypothetical protein
MLRDFRRKLKSNFLERRLNLQLLNVRKALFLNFNDLTNQFNVEGILK